MALVRWLIILLTIGFAVMVWFHPDLLIRLIDPTAERSREWIEQRRETTDTELADPATSQRPVLPAPDIPEIVMVDAPELAETLRETGFIANHSTKPDLPEFASATPVGAGDFVRNIQTIVGGVEEDIAAVPWLVGLRVHTEIVHNGNLAIATELCGGGVYGDRWVITAAHCVEGDYNEIEVIAGATDLDSPLAVRRVTQRSFIHAGYERDVLREDIAVIELVEPLPDFIPRGPWPTIEQAPQIPAIRQVTGRGFGVTASGRASNSLRRVDLDVQDTTLRVIRVGDSEGNVRGICQGDSGTPVTGLIGESTVIIGMVSYTEAVPGAANCSTPGFVAGLVSLEGYLDDITSLVNLCSAEPEKCDA